jgi:hypothetical protein
MMNPFITFFTAAMPIDVGASTAELGQTLAMVGHTDAVRRSARLGPCSNRFEDPFYPSAGVTPSSAVNRRCGIRLVPGGRRYTGAGVGLDILARPLAAP